MQESGLAIPSVFCQVSCYPSVALPLSFRYPSVLLVRHHTRDGNESQGCSIWDLAGSPTDLSICRWDDLLLGGITIYGEGVDRYNRSDDITKLHRMPKNNHSHTKCSSPTGQLQMPRNGSRTSAAFPSIVPFHSSSVFLPFRVSPRFGNIGSPEAHPQKQS